VLPTTSVVRIVLSRLPADDSNDSVPVIDGYSTTRISLLFPGTKQGPPAGTRPVSGRRFEFRKRLARKRGNSRGQWSQKPRRYGSQKA